MITARLTEDERFLQIDTDASMEYQQMQICFKRRISSWRFDPRVKRGIWDGYISYMDRYGRIPVGLWHELKKNCKEFDIDLEFDEKCIIDSKIDKKEFEDWVWEFFKDDDTYGKGSKKQIRDYQIDAVYNILRAKRSCSEIATSAGKTLMIYLTLAYLLDNNISKRCVIVVPNTSLIMQTMEDFEEYNAGDKIEDLVVQGIHGGTSKLKSNAQIVIGTFQSLTKLPQEWFEDVDVVCVDEAHFTNCRSVKDIIMKCCNNEYAFGLSGTVKGDMKSADYYTLQAYLGPFINDISANFLIKNDYVTKVVVKVVRLNYLSNEIRKKLALVETKKQEGEGSKLLALEKKLVQENRTRFNFVCDFISKATKNSLVLFADVKGKYGRSIYEWLRNNTQKTIYYVDGATDPKMRDEYFDAMRNADDCILVASFGTLSTGVSINSIYNIYFLESYKSDKIIRQSIGRGMRKQEGKDQVNIIDFVDDFSIDGNKNYLLRHGEKRIKIYKEQKFPFKVWTVDLMKKNLF